eukprot:scaffold19730_cov86-Phaeocystis_antarctica.AAC.1
MASYTRCSPTPSQNVPSSTLYFDTPDDMACPATVRATVDVTANTPRRRGRAAKLSTGRRRPTPQKSTSRSSAARSA